MPEDWSGVTAVLYGCRDCDDFGGDAKNGVGLAAQHARRTGHHAWAELTRHYSFNDPGEDGAA